MLRERAPSSGLEAPPGADDPSARALEVLRARDPSDARYETRDDPRIPPDKAFFKIGEVAEITGIKPYVLRYWEDEFPWIKPEKTRSRQRRYRRQDIALLLEISRLRYEERKTIEGARQSIRERRAERVHAKRKPPPARLAAALNALRTGDARSTTGLPQERNDRRASLLAQAIGDMRKTVLELLEAVEE